MILVQIFFVYYDLFSLIYSDLLLFSANQVIFSKNLWIVKGNILKILSVNYSWCFDKIQIVNDIEYRGHVLGQ